MTRLDTAPWLTCVPNIGAHTWGRSADTMHLSWLRSGAANPDAAGVPASNPSQAQSLHMTPLPLSETSSPRSPTRLVSHVNAPNLPVCVCVCVCVCVWCVVCA